MDDLSVNGCTSGGSWAWILGIAVALAAMAVSCRAIRWPAPGIAIGLGIAAYLLARGRAD